MSNGVRHQFLNELVSDTKKTMPIPIYPKFRPLLLEDKTLFDSAFKKNQPEISEFTFTNLYSWREAYKFQVSRLKDFLLLSANDSGKAEFFEPIGIGDIKGTIEQVINERKENFIRIPEKIRTLFAQEKRYSFTPDRNYFDYVYKVSDLIELKGSKYDGKRNLIKNFKAKHSYEYIKLSAENANDILQFEDYWCNIKNCDLVKGLSDERRAIREMVANFKSFGLSGGAIKIMDSIRAIALGERLNEDTLVMHVLKADPALMGLYQVINQEFLSKDGAGFTFVNFEEDLGEVGLRKFKQSYHPLKMINKYILK